MAVREIRRGRGEGGSVGGFADRCAACLEAFYAGTASHLGDTSPNGLCVSAVRRVVQLVAVLLASERVPSNHAAREAIRRAAQAAVESSTGQGGRWSQAYLPALRGAYEASGADIFRPDDGPPLPEDAFAAASAALLGPRPDAPIEPIFFQTMPLSWLGHAYQTLLGYRAASSGDCLELSSTGRKGRGVYFTPPSLVSYITESVLGPLIGSTAAGLGDEARTLTDLRVLDPAMGGGDFLVEAIDFISGERGGARAEAAAECVYGVDIDPIAVEIARFAVWAASGFAEGIYGRICSHLIRADALGQGHESQPIDWAEAFRGVFERQPAGFDAVVGNPPYIAAKNGLARPRRSRGQPDSYLLFLSTALDRGLVRPGGMLSMVLPDPMLVRGNAAEIRRRLVGEWSLLSLLHIYGAFPEVEVANVVPVFRNLPNSGRVFPASRIERVADRKSFVLRPRETAEALSHPVKLETVLAQPRCELLYMLNEGAFGSVIRRIHGENGSLSSYQAPFAPLREMNIEAIYRGEEVGKSAIDRERGDMPMLLGGQSIAPYAITWEGRRTDLSRITKPIERYRSTKILVQKSSARIVAALDEVRRRHPGYAFPQSVYGIELRQPGMHELYLLCILNSQLMNEYVRRAVTGYKMVQPQLELEDIRALPIRRISFTTPPGEREAEVMRGVRLFEDESLRSAGAAPFSELANFAVACLTGHPEKSDVVHDLLVYLGRLVVDLTRDNRASPDPDTTLRLESARRAVETLVWRLYSSEPAQMALPF